MMWRKIKDNRLAATYYDFWYNYLTDQVLNIIDVDGMDPQEAIGFKLSVLMLGRTAFFRAPDSDKVMNSWYASGGKIGFYPTYYNALITNPTMTNIPVMDLYKDAWPVYCMETDSILYNDGHGGYSDLVAITARQLSENALSTEQLQYIKRLPTLFSARTDTEYRGILELLNRIKKGVTHVVVKTPLQNSVQRFEAAQGVSKLSEMTEYQQYVLGQFYAAIGIDAPWNIKRAQVSAAETNQNTDLSKYNILPVSDRIQKQLDAVNKNFGTNYHIKTTVDKVDAEQREEVTRNDDSGPSDDVGRTASDSNSPI